MTHAARHAAAPLGYTTGQIETLKWLGLASMFTDHIGRQLLGMPFESWAFILGRLSFPLFALVLGMNLAREGDRAERAARTTLRLCAWGAVAVLPSIWARGEPMMLNVLFTLGLGAAVCWALESAAATWQRALACFAIAGASWFVEFGIAGVFLVAAVYLWCTRRDGGVAFLLVLLLAATGWLSSLFGGWASFVATVAALPLAWAVRHLPVAMPRLQYLFYAIYPVHLAVIGWLKIQ